MKKMTMKGISGIITSRIKINIILNFYFSVKFSGQSSRREIFEKFFVDFNLRGKTEYV